MTGMEYLTPDGQQLTLDVTACVCVWGGGFSATKTKVAQNCLKWINLRSKKFPSWGGGGGGLFCQSFSQSSNFQTKFAVDKMFTF